MSHSQTHFDHWQHACERLDEAEKLVVSAHGANRTVLLDAIERWTRVRDWAAFELIHGSAEESKRAWAEIVDPDESESE